MKTNLRLVEARTSCRWILKVRPFPRRIRTATAAAAAAATAVHSTRASKAVNECILSNMKVAGTDDCGCLNLFGWLSRSAGGQSVGRSVGLHIRSSCTNQSNARDGIAIKWRYWRARRLNTASSARQQALIARNIALDVYQLWLPIQTLLIQMH